MENPLCYGMLRVHDWYQKGSVKCILSCCEDSDRISSCIFLGEFTTHWRRPWDSGSWGYVFHIFPPRNGMNIAAIAILVQHGSWRIWSIIPFKCVIVPLSLTFLSSYWVALNQSIDIHWYAHEWSNKWGHGRKSVEQKYDKSQLKEGPFRPIWPQLRSLQII